MKWIVSSGPVEWLRVRPTVADGVLAALVGGLLVTTELVSDRSSATPASVAMLAVAALVLAWRRRHPTRVLNVVAAISLAYVVLTDGTTSPDVAVLLALYSEAAHGRERDALITATVGPVALAVALAFNVERYELTVPGVAASYLVLALVWALGMNTRARRQRVEALEARAVALERERQEAGRAAVSQERSRIARELHDVVAHHVSVMVVQAGAARRVLAADPAAATAALATVEGVGREALDELSRVLGVLRGEAGETGDAVATRSPQPTLAAVGELVAHGEAAGLTTSLAVEGQPRPVPPGVDLTGYRIVQEALTNAVKHAGPAAATITVRYTDDHVEVTVVDDGRGGSVTGGAGHGLLGMRERVELFGGELRVGPRLGGGFGVRARLPTASGAGR